MYGLQKWPESWRCHVYGTCSSRSVAVSAFRPLPKAATSMADHPSHPTQLHLDIKDGRAMVYCRRQRCNDGKRDAYITKGKCHVQERVMSIASRQPTPTRHDATFRP